MNWLLENALKYRAVTLVTWLALLLAGTVAWLTLKKEAYPDIGDTQVTVITTFPGRAAKEVEQQVTIPLERVLNSIPRVIARRSKTIFGLSVIQLTFAEDVDDYFARQRVLERLGDADLPQGVQPALGPLTGPVGEIFRYVIAADESHTPMELRTLQDWVVTPRLLQVLGVADVINFGGLVKQFHVVTAPDKLVQFGITLQNVIDAISANNVNTGGNIIVRGAQGFALRAMGAISDITHLENVVVTSVRGVPIFVKDIARVQEFPKAPSGLLGYRIKEDDHTYTDVASGVQGLIAMLRGQNPSDVAARVQVKVKEINERWLPAGVRLKVTYDRSDLVNYTLHTVAKTIFEGISIVVIVLMLFLGSPRAAGLVAVTIPLSLVFSFLMMKLTGIEANLLSLGAIDFGIIVDAAVVVVENILRRSHGAPAAPVAGPRGRVEEVQESTADVAREITCSIAIIILAYMPIFSLERIEGRLFRPMAFTLSYAVLGALLLSLTLVPVLLTFPTVYREGVDRFSLFVHRTSDRVLAYFYEIYRRALLPAMAHPKRVIQAAGGLLALTALVAFFFVGTEFLPDLDEGALNIRAFFPVGMTIQEGRKYAPLIREIIGRNQPVQIVITQLGRNDDGTDPYGPNRMEVLVGLRDRAHWTRGLTRDGLTDKIQNDLEAELPGVLFSFSQPILDNVTEAATGSVADLAVLLSGEDTDVMREQARKILQVVRSVRGASESGIEQEPEQSQLVVEVDRAKVARYGINVADIQRMIEAAVGAGAIGKLYDGERRFDIVVRYSLDYRASPEAIERLLIPAPGGARIPLSQLAKISLKAGPTIIQRQDGRRQISVRTNVRDRDQGSFVAEAQKKVAKILSLPDGYEIRWGGQFENLARASKRLAIVIPMTIVIIFLLLWTLYHNATHSLVALSSIPIAFVGGVGALLARGYPFNVSAGVGFISLFGIATMSGVLYVSRVRKLTEEKPTEKISTLALDAALLQLRPRLMTMSLALFGLIPASLATGIGSDVQRPLATVVVGGLLSSLLLGLVLMPVLYLVAETWRLSPRKGFGFRWRMPAPAREGM